MNLTPCEKMKQRIMNEDIKIVSKNSYGKDNYSYSLVTDSTGDIVERLIVEPMFPEISNEEQAFSLAHELGHHQAYIKRSKLSRNFFTNIRDIKGRNFFSLFTFPFIIYDEYKAWKNASKICKEEQILNSLEANLSYEYRKQFALQTYWSEYKNNMFGTLKWFVSTYISCILIVLFLYLTYQAQIYIPLLHDVQEAIGTSENRTGFVNSIYTVFIVTMLILGLMKLIININFTEYKGTVFGNNRK
ncbi:hypothetical protein P4T70_31900 [Bacillus mobilis]|uniref:hypothetical protein n=1 Tax=Bacillus mobilis TaxID=2026190 RepID=UPI002E1FF848|nr:hypothetical protein [Bacillus mobilis]